MSPTPFPTCLDGVAGVRFEAAVDTAIDEINPDTSDASDYILDVVTDYDYDYDGILLDRQALIKFPEVATIPAGSTITNAVLYVTRFGGNDGTAPINFHRMITPWSDTVTWNSGFGGNGISTDNVEAVATASFSISATEAEGDYYDYRDFGPQEDRRSCLDATADVEAWVNGGVANEGWVIINPDDNDWDLNSVENPYVEFRPILIVEFTPP